ncbi:MAG: DUF998 domain-containing protein [Methanomassiliicoccaceae archaeon]|nr:DUF998 domain-containing protein [Methanomassiliicoccaceae archaeon]
MFPSGTKIPSVILMIGIALFAFCWMGAVLLDPSWTFGVNTMSELGISKTNARYLFLIGCLGTGICTCIYGALMAYSLKPMLLRSVFIILSVAGIFLMGVGFFTMDTDLHIVFTAAFFISVALCMVIYALYVAFAEENYLLGIYTAVLIVVNVLLLLLTPLAFVEPVAVILFMIWILSINHSFFWNEDKWFIINYGR